MSNRTDPRQLIGGQTAAASPTALAWGTAQAVSSPPTNVGAVVPVTAPTNT